MKRFMKYLCLLQEEDELRIKRIAYRIAEGIIVKMPAIPFRE